MTITPAQQMRATLQAQREAFLQEGSPNAQVREERLNRLLLLLLENAHAIADAIHQDYGNRPVGLTMATDIFGVIPSLKRTRKHLRQWMKPERVSTGLLGLTGARAWLQYQPLGVVGIISPWNFPVALSLHPMIEALAAGNRCMLKVSELTPRTAQLLSTVFAKHFDPSVVAVFTGAADVAAEFSSLPFDHIFVTSSPQIGRQVQRAAAENLVPCTLELGGKCPALISPEADMAKAAERIAWGKTANAGQTCLSPDYVLVPEGRQQEFVDQIKTAVTKMFSSLLDNPDYTSIVAERHFQRLTGWIDEARAMPGVQVVEINPANEDFSQQPHFKIPPTLILGGTRDLKCLSEEIFGPLLPIVTYRTLDEAIDWINAGPRPLGAYYFGRNDAGFRRYTDRVVSGGAVLNDVIVHVLMDTLPFGGIGESGMGHYHGRFGFKTFSHTRAVLRAGLLSPAILMKPPYAKLQKLFDWMLRRELASVHRKLAHRK